MSETASSNGWFGRTLPAKEGDVLVRGAGRFVADIRLPEMVEVAFVRSELAHASIGHVDVTSAREHDGVVTALSGEDVADAIEPFRRFVDQEHTPPRLASRVAPEIHHCEMPVLPTRVVHYVGQAVACVVAEDRYLAEDAAELVVVDYEELPVVTDPEVARSADAPLLHEPVPGNVHARFSVEVGDVDEALAGAPNRVTLRFRTQRVASTPMETRGVVASWSEATGELTLWSSTQTPHMVRTRIAEQLHLPEDRVRVIAPHVGGGFGPKAQIYPEELVVAHLARALGRPVRWIEDRREHLLATAQSRDQLHTAEVGFDDAGEIVAIRDRFLVDCGAYNPFSITCAYNTAAHFRGVFKVPHFEASSECVLTNKTPNVPYRGAGRPEAAFAMDRIVSEVARRLELDPADVLRRNLIPVSEMPCARGMPYRDGEEIVYDCGDFSSAFDRLLERVDYEAHRRTQTELREGGVWRGIGFGSYIEGTGIGPYESAAVELDSQGRVVISSGSSPHGQSHDTTFSQLVADELGVSPHEVVFRAGDTALTPYGVGTFASRSLVNAGSAVAISAQNLRRRIEAIAANLMEAPAYDLTLDAGRVFVRGVPQRSLSFEEVYRAAAPGRHSAVPDDLDPGIKEGHHFVPPTVTFAFGLVAAVVQVDVDTGLVELERLAIIHDCGRILNPSVVEGQIDGGLAQGIGAAMYEEVVYDELGQPLTTTLADYMVPTAAEIPALEQEHLEVPSDRNPLGVKGVGEAGAISPPGAIANAVVDALRPMRIELTELPLSPAAVHRAIARAGEATTNGGNP